jgi:hypothetical protein
VRAGAAAGAAFAAVWANAGRTASSSDIAATQPMAHCMRARDPRYLVTRRASVKFRSLKNI